MNRPWLKFYTSDWRADPALRMCSLGARGLWLEMLCIMHEAEPYGHLRVNGEPVGEKELSALVGAGSREVFAQLSELKRRGVFDVEDGVIVSRRMVRDHAKALKDQANGRNGGNPHLKPKQPEGVNPDVKRQDKAQKPEARSQIPERENPSPQSTSLAPERAAAADSKVSIEEVERRCLEATDWHATKGISAIADLIGSGVDFEDRILPMLRTMARDHRAIGKEPPKVWAYAVKVIQDPTRRPQGEEAPAVSVVWVPEDSPAWEKLLAGGRKASYLRTMLKPASDGHEGIWVPSDWLSGRAA